jgi:adenylate cyclase class 2
MQKEIEAKFYCPHLAALRQELINAGGRLHVSRQFEKNWRFDNNDGKLSGTGRVLRLRQDRRGLLTFKQQYDSPEVRSEIEFEVSDLKLARTFLEALGYHVYAGYEKYREVFMFEGAHVMLDELPFGNFIEIEADSVQQLKAVGEMLGFSWKHRVQASYLELYERLRRQLDLEFSEVTFDDFEKLAPIQAADLGLST